MTIYSPAPEVQTVAGKLIPFHHPHLAGVRIEFVFRESIQTSGGVQKWGSARKVSGLSALLGTPGALDSSSLDFFVIEVSRPVWDELSSAQKSALVDHELSHCGLKIDDESGYVKLVILPHDMEEFSGVLNRHGSWRTEVEEFLADVGQARLLGFADGLDAPADPDASNDAQPPQTPAMAGS
jgi:hypothetical protein